MNVKLRAVVAFVASLLLSPAALHAADAAPHLTPAIVLEENGVQADRAFFAAIKLDIPAGWHLYWQNPGDSGQAPKVNWKLPPGFTAGETLWPRPARLVTGPVVNFGYSDSLLLPVRVEPPPSLSTKKIDLGAHVKWLVCQDTCIPGEADVSFSVPVLTTTPAKSALAPFFDRTRAALASPAPVDWQVTATAEGDSFVLTVSDPQGRLAGDTTFFPLHRYQIDNQARADS